ncbi:MAG: hypothetical protein V1678_04570 [Candidatus Aenigmatarchaeota archaeon]
MKAELFSSDFLISFFIFLSAFIIMVSYYQNIQTDVYETSMRNDMISKDISIASLLATTSGQPRYWNFNSTDAQYVQVIGLYDSGKFNLTKFEYLKTDNCTNARSMLGTGAYNLYIILKNTTGGVLQKSDGYSYFCGNPATNEEQTVIVKRLGVVDIEGNITKVTMEVILWV